MQTVFEIFDPVTGNTEGYKTLDGAKTFCDRMERAGYIRDYVPATQEGFYVVDMRGTVKAGAMMKDDAERKASFENQANDHNSFSVVHHTL